MENETKVAKMSFFEVFKGEAKLLFSDIAIVLTIFGGVILYSFLYPQPYLKESVSELPVSVVDYDKSDTSRNYIFNLDATPQVKVIRQDMSKKDALDALVTNKIKGVIIIPAHFKKDLALGKSPTIALGVDNSYFLIYGGVLEATLKTTLTYAAGMKVANLLKQQLPLAKAKEAFTPYSLNDIALFNRYNSYTQYVIPAVFVLILQQTMLIGMGILGGGINERIRKKEKGYFVDADVWQVIVSRCILFGGIFFIHMIYYFGFSFTFFDVSHLGSIEDILKFGFAFLAASLALGIFLGSIFTSREIATPAVLFSSLPLVFSAGFVWPFEAMPEFIRELALLSPSTPAIQGFLQLNQMGAEFSMVKENYALLWIQALIYIILGYYFMSKNKRKIDGTI